MSAVNNGAGDGEGSWQVGGRADVLDFWRAVELFAGQDAPKVSAARHVYRAGEEGLPWEERHPLRGEWIGDKQAWQHVVYCGVYSLQDAFDEIRARFPTQGDVYDEGPPAGHGALAVFVVGDDGRAVLGSRVLASCAWAVARTLLRGPSAVGSGGFEEIAARFGARFEELFDADDDDEEAQELKGEGHPVGAALDLDALEECLEMLIDLLGIDGIEHGAALGQISEIRIQSRRVSIREARQPGERELLNSFFAADLGKVADALRAGRCGAALREYLTSAEDIDTGRRVDVERDLGHVRRGLSARRIPGGRWPSVASQQLALGQQFAVNSIAGAERSQAQESTPAGPGAQPAEESTPASPDAQPLAEGTPPGTGAQAAEESTPPGADAQHVFAVNGPPGTGKTVMLRELLAATVVQRATLLAELDRPADAFRSAVGWSAGSYRRTVHPLKDHLTGFEIVLACATNAAAENVTAEIPALQAIHSSWHGEIDHFADLATAMLGGDPSEGDGRAAWALISAALGSRSRNKAFVSRLWFGGLKESLHELDAPAQEWEDAVADYRAALQRVEDIRAERTVYSDLFDQRDAVLSESERQSREGARARASLAAAERRLAEHRQALTEARDARERCGQDRKRHRETQPGMWERLRTAGRASREWRAEDARRAEALAVAERAVGEAETSHEQAAAEVEQLAREAERHEQLQHAAHAQAEELARLLPDACEQWSQEHPDIPFPDERWEQPSERQRREQHPPWVDEVWNEARTER